LAIDKFEQPWALIKQRDFGSERGKHGSVFQTDDSCAHDDQVTRDLLQAMNLIRIEDSLAVYGDVLAVRGARAASDQNVLAAKEMGAVAVRNLHGVSVEKARVAFNKIDEIAPQLCLDDFDLAGHDSFRAKDQIAHGNSLFQGVSAAVEGPLAEAT